MPLTVLRYGPGLSPMLSPFSREGNAAAGVGMIANPGFSSLVSVAVNTAYYTPVVLPVVGLARKLWWLNGTTASTNNIQCGVYADNGSYNPGAAIIRGTSTLASGASVLQYDDIADTQMGPGLVWLAIWFSGTTTTVQGTGGSGQRTDKAFFEQSLTGGLPATATPVQNSGAVRIFVAGIQFRVSP